MVTQQDWGMFAFRFVVGLIFFLHGWQKLFAMGLPGVTGMVQSIGFPLPSFFAILLIATEFLGGLFLLVGLFTRWVTLPLMFAMLVAIFTVHLSKGFFLSSGGLEYPLLLLGCLIGITFLPPSKISLDSFFSTRLL
jgi:putative oxidoreductase